jgi:Cu/Ag efflux protein CusF
VVVVASRLRNGTYKAAQTRVAGVARRARLRGTVTYADRARRSFVISTRGASLVIHAGGRRHGRARAADALPAVGADVTVSATLGAQGDVVAQQVSNKGAAQGTVDLEGTVRSIDEAAGTLTLSADDAEEMGAASITLRMPDTFDLSAYSVGDELELTATLNADGTYTAVGSSDDGDAEQADDAADDQGDDRGDDSGSDDGAGVGSHESSQGSSHGGSGDSGDEGDNSAAGDE